MVGREPHPVRLVVRKEAPVWIGVSGDNAVVGVNDDALAGGSVSFALAVLKVTGTVP